MSTEKTEQENLLPCPFCGCRNIHVSADHNTGYKAIGVHFCYCTNPECLSRVFQPDNSREAAIKAWNNRNDGIAYENVFDAIYSETEQAQKIVELLARVEDLERKLHSGGCPMYDPEKKVCIME